MNYETKVMLNSMFGDFVLSTSIEHIKYKRRLILKFPTRLNPLKLNPLKLKIRFVIGV